MVLLVQVLVVPFDMCWGLDVSASLVLVMGTESYDGREHKYVDYPVTDMLQMTGLASRCGVKIERWLLRLSRKRRLIFLFFFFFFVRRKGPLYCAFFLFVFVFTCLVRRVRSGCGCVDRYCFFWGGGRRLTEGTDSIYMFSCLVCRGKGRGYTSKCVVEAKNVFGVFDEDD